MIADFLKNQKLTKIVCMSAADEPMEFVSTAESRLPEKAESNLRVRQRDSVSAMVLAVRLVCVSMIFKF